MVSQTMRGELAASVAEICNISLLCQTAPRQWCEGWISPVPKPDGSYRPITILNSMSKVWEGHLRWLLRGFLRCHDRQFGFTEGSGCADAFLRLQLDVLELAALAKGPAYFTLIYTWAVGIGKIGNRVAIGAKICPIGPPPIESGRIGQKTNFGHWDRPPFGCRSDWLQSNRIRSAKKQISATGIGPNRIGFNRNLFERAGRCVSFEEEWMTLCLGMYCSPVLPSCVVV